MTASASAAAAIKRGRRAEPGSSSSNELLELFSDSRIIRYEDEMAVADFGQQNVRVVQLAAMKADS